MRKTITKNDGCQLEAFSFRIELLPSRKQVDEIMSKLSGDQSIRNLQKVGVNVLHREKEKEGESHYKIINLDRGAIREALKFYSGRPVYLYWKEKRESGKKGGVIGKKVKKQINL
ncbi:MAG: hypothetical protein M1368_06040 [Thaumarchaeota archaeon]|nr:hypothetical protein [Nitrososphaerota archaeon]